MATVGEVWNWVRERRTIVPRFAEIASSQVTPPLASAEALIPQQHYFAVVVDELFLASSRQWYQEFDPMVLAVTEFVYGGKQVTLPFVIGPTLLGDKATSVPQGMLYRGTRVAGVHPFRGGRVVSTVVLCQVRRRNHSRQLLKVVESIAATIPFAAEVGTYVRLAGPLLDGIDALFGIGETTPLVGIRQEFDHDLGSSIRPAYFVLIDGAEDKFPLSRLWVGGGGLMAGEAKEQVLPMREASYVLFSTRGAAELSEVDTLPIQTTASTVIDLAASNDPADWKRAKAELFVLFRQLLSSPDLTRQQALSFHEKIVQQVRDARARATSIGALGAEADATIQHELRRATQLLDLA